MFTEIQLSNDKAQLTGAGLKKLILDRRPVKILEQMHTVDLTGRTDQEMINTITKAGRTAEKWDEAKKNLKTKTPKKTERRFEKPKDNFQVQKSYQRKDSFKNKKFVNRDDGSKVKTFATQIEGVPQEELNQRLSAKECMRCAWPADRKGSHKTMDRYRPLKMEEGTASFPKAKEYQKMKIGACDQQEDQQDLYTEGSDSEELRDSASEEGSSLTDKEESSEVDSEEESEQGDNWCE